MKLLLLLHIILTLIFQVYILILVLGAFIHGYVSCILQWLRGLSYLLSLTRSSSYIFTEKP